MVMPSGLTGVDVASRAKSLHPGIKVVITSGYTRYSISEFQDIDRGIEFMPKPFEFGGLERTLRRIMQEN